MEFWRKDYIENGYGNTYGYFLINGDNVFSISKDDLDTNSIKILEECDGHFSITLTKEDAIAAFKELLEIIELL